MVLFKRVEAPSSILVVNKTTRIIKKSNTGPKSKKSLHSENNEDGNE